MIAWIQPTATRSVGFYNTTLSICRKTVWYQLLSCRFNKILNLSIIQNSKYVYKNISLYLIHDILLSSSTLMFSLRNTKFDGLIGVPRTCSCSTSRPQQVQKNLFCLDCGEVWLETRNKYSSKGRLNYFYLEKIEKNPLKIPTKYGPHPQDFFRGKLN